MRYSDIDWRGFNVPWVYTSSDDIFVYPSRPPSSETLSWEPDFFHDHDGNVVYETERPIQYDLMDTAVDQVSAWLNDRVWSGVTRALQSSLFETPIAHFLVRAFLSEPLDEFLAHITTIEASLGLQSDYVRADRPKIARKLRATDCIAARVSALLGSRSHGEDYCRLFEIRSVFLHGRKMAGIPGEYRIAARRLARRVVNELIGAALAERNLAREAYLNGLLTHALA